MAAAVTAAKKAKVKRKLKVAAPAPLIKLDIGCGQRKEPGFVGLDISTDVGADIVWDFDKYPFPLEDGSVKEIRCVHVLEHVDSLIGFMNECHRILVPQGTMLVISPYYTSVRCWQDPTHKHAISEISFLYYNKEWREANLLQHYAITADFDFTFGYAFDPYWAAKAEEARSFALRHYWNVASDIQVVLTKR